MTGGVKRLQWWGQPAEWWGFDPTSYNLKICTGYKTCFIERKIMDLELENVIWAFGLKVCIEFSRRRKKISKKKK